MKNKATELVFILDRSGSMWGLEGDTVGGFNSMIKKQKRKKGECFVTTVLFNDKHEMLHDRERLSEIGTLSEADYEVYGCTALIDALGDTINHISNIHKYARLQDVPKHTMFVIITDGMENASKSYTSAQIKEMIEEKKNEYGWEFLFLGANIDAVETAAQYGIASDRAVNYKADSRGTKLNFEVMAQAICDVREDCVLSPMWKQEIEEDFLNRRV